MEEWIKMCWEFPGCPVVRALHFHFGDHRFEQVATRDQKQKKIVWYVYTMGYYSAIKRMK